MKMKSLNKAALASAILVASGSATAANMYIDLGTNSYDTARAIGAPDGDTTTAIFNEFGFSQLLATSVYDITDGTVFGSFYDTNLPADLAAAGLPAAGIAMDGVTPVNLVLPDCPAGQCDIDALSPLVPPLGSDNEGFLQTWDLQVEYNFQGTLLAGGPVYTGGYLKVYFNDLLNDANDRLIMEGTLTGSDLQVANLNLFFDITTAEQGWLWIENDGGVFVDAYDGTQSGTFAKMTLDTNVNPPIPTLDQLLAIDTDADQIPDVAVRQTTLDGSATAAIPEPSTIALVGLGLLGFGAVARRRARQ